MTASSFHLDAVWPKALSAAKHAQLFVDGCRSVVGGVYVLGFHAGGAPTLVEVAA